MLASLAYVTQCIAHSLIGLSRLDHEARHLDGQLPPSPGDAVINALLGISELPIVTPMLVMLKACVGAASSTPPRSVPLAGDLRKRLDMRRTGTGPRTNPHAAP